MAEEAFGGKFGEKYQDWAVTVPAFVPKFWGTPRSSAPAGNAFSLRHVIKREYNGVFAIVFGLFFLEAPERQAACLHGIQRYGKRPRGAWRCFFSCDFASGPKYPRGRPGIQRLNQVTAPGARCDARAPARTV